MKLRDAAVLFGVSSVVLVVNVLLLSHHYQKKQQKYDNFIKTHSDFLPPPDAYDKAIPKTALSDLRFCKCWFGWNPNGGVVAL